MDTMADLLDPVIKAQVNTTQRSFCRVLLASPSSPFYPLLQVFDLFAASGVSDAC